jgi:hypothetical protein
MVTGIGSLPFKDVDQAIDLIFLTCKEVPFWPQLPKRSNKENMYVPFVEGIPFFKITGENSVYLDEECVDNIEEFFYKVNEQDIRYFSISENLIPGFFRLMERMGEISETLKAVKTQITGPITMGLGIKDTRGVPIIYNSFLFDIVKKTINMKAKWMVSELKKHFPEKDVIIFFDEPYLSAYGSIYFSFPEEDVIKALDEVTIGIKGKKGVHCCGNTDWSLLFKTKMDIINYDAFNYLHSLFLYREDLRDFFRRNGLISPGIVPSTEEIKHTKKGDVSKILSDFLREMKKTKGEIDIKEILITPSCGLANLDVEDAKKAMDMLRDIPEMVLQFFDNEWPS